jgi:adenylyltransferase/sulfurtransferase
MNDEQLLRFSRQIMLPEIDISGQERLRQAKVLVVGLGGLGSPAALYLAASGVGELRLADPDRVEIANLQRQILYTMADLGRPKVVTARGRLLALDPDLTVVELPGRLEGERLTEQVAAVDAVVDGSDNFATRLALNAACLAAGRPLVSGAAVRFSGQISVFYPGQDEDAPCYRCLYAEGEEPPEGCVTNGVVAPLVGIIGSIQALETLKVLLGIGKTLKGRLLCLDGLDMEWRSYRFGRDPGCPVCAQAA